MMMPYCKILTGEDKHSCGNKWLEFLAYYCKAPGQLDSETWLFSVAAALCSSPMVLCDPGEAFLTPTQFSAGFTFTPTCM